MERSTPTSRRPGVRLAPTGSTSWTGSLLAGWECRSIWAATAAIFAASALIAPRSLSWSSWIAMLSFAAVLIVVSAGQTLVVQQRGIDLSVPGAVTLCAMVSPLYVAKSHASLGTAIVVTFAVGVCIGLVNGLLVIKIGITPLVATLAVNSLLIGALLTYNGGLPSVNAPRGLVSFAAARVIGLPVMFVVALGYVAVVAFGMQRTVVGRRFVAVGVNPTTAKAVGVPTDRYVIAAYAFGGVSSALGGVLLLGYLESASLSTGNDYLFTSIAAVVLGGTSLAGGKGSVIASSVSALFLTQLVQLLLTAGASSSVQLLAQAVAIGLAVVLRSVAGGRDWQRLRAMVDPWGRRGPRVQTNVWKAPEV